MRKPIPGYRYFFCEGCHISQAIPTQNCMSPSLESCEKCGEDIFPEACEWHPEWKVDQSGNLVSPIPPTIFEVGRKP